MVIGSVTESAKINEGAIFVIVLFLVYIAGHGSCVCYEGGQT
jgi:predicted RNase H-related nuclease YkuK (DUF458 family)